MLVACPERQAVAGRREDRRLHLESFFGAFEKKQGIRKTLSRTLLDTIATTSANWREVRRVLL
jgi:hypothetical protein